MVGVGTALHNGDVEAVFGIGAVGDGLIEAAMLGFGDPIGREGDLVEVFGRRRLAGRGGRGKRHRHGDRRRAKDVSRRAGGTSQPSKPHCNLR